MSGETIQFPTAKGTMERLIKGANYDEMPPDAKEPLIAYMVRKLSTFEVMGRDIMYRKIFGELGEQPDTVTGIISDLVVGGLDLSTVEQEQYLRVWLNRQRKQLDDATFGYLLRRLPDHLRTAYETPDQLGAEDEGRLLGWLANQEPFLGPANFAELLRHVRPMLAEKYRQSAGQPRVA